jgi:hypothetical protein
MSLANLSIIEKDDLIKKMPKDALKRELREPSGNFPLFLIASRLKDVETMEKESMARQFSQESQGDEPTIAHRLAREVMPQAPISGMAAMPSPQPRPDPQGQMAQALAGPQREMPTVYRNQGGLAALGGAAMPATYEALMQNPEILGLGPFLASSFLDGDDDAPAPTSAPVPQERPILPPTVQVQPNQVPGSNAPVQISGGDTLPTIRAQSGLKGSYPGDASRITAEMLAAAARRRKEGGKPRLYNQGRKVSFEEAIKKGASPAAQMAAMYGIPSAIARQEERVFGGMDTLPPYQPESNPMALRSKGFTSPTRTLPHRGADEGASGLDYLKMMKDIAGDSDDLPTVFAQAGYPGTEINPTTRRREIVDISPETTVTGYLNRSFPMPGPNEYFQQGEDLIPARKFVESQMKRASGIQAAAGGTDVDRMSQLDLEGNRMTPVPKFEGRRVISEDYFNAAGQLIDPAGLFLQPKSGANDISDAYTAAQTGSVAEGNAKALAQPSSSLDVKDTTPVTTSAPASATSASVVAPAAAPAQTPFDLGRMKKRLGMSSQDGAVQVGAVDSIGEFQKIYDALLPDQSKAREKITKDYEKVLQEEKARDVVPQGLKDIRSEYENRIEALDKSGLPFMTAAAAVLKGNQPTLVALTNAMIGYTAGDEQLKKQGLSLIKDMSKLDIDVATLEAAQRQEVNKSRTAVMKAREAELAGNEARAAAVLDVASKARTSAQNLEIKRAELQDRSEQRKNQIFATIAPTLIKTEREDRILKEAIQAYIKQGLPEGEAKLKAIQMLEGSRGNPFAEQNQMLKLEAANLRRDAQITKFFKDASNDPSRNLKIKDAAKKDNLKLTGDDLMLYGVQKGLVPITNALRNTPAGKSIIQDAEQKFGPKAQGGKESNGRATWDQM